MIWFTCKQCGKTHGRPENSVGSLVFCECGAGNTVPWESTVAEPEQPAAAPAALWTRGRAGAGADVVRADDRADQGR